MRRKSSCRFQGGNVGLSGGQPRLGEKVEIQKDGESIEEGRVGLVGD